MEDAFCPFVHIGVCVYIGKIELKAREKTKKIDKMYQIIFVYHQISAIILLINYGRRAK